jgi:cellulose synthase (UDP-forming)
MSPKHRPAVRALRLLVSCAATFLLFQLVSLYLSWPKQAVLGGVSLLIVLLLNRSSRSHTVTLALMLFSIATTLRYGWWRIHLVVNFFSDESNHRLSIDGVLMLILLSAELYTALIMVLGYMQTSFPLRRKPVPMPHSEDDWPHVDVLIPTYNEPLSLVRYTALAAINIDYPPEKLHIYILDDGTRDDFRRFAEEAGIGYITRKEHLHAKAGNINHALTGMDSPFVAIFDCDHVPTRSFLQFTLGWFLAEERLAMLQTPHHFYSPDPFERNLLRYKTIPNEGELFYGIIQDGNDFWNATFFCGSCAVIRRQALDQAGGIATETVTEDAHTSLRMQKLGWNTAYINIAQAAGLATETLAAHVGQRVRWARGMVQILRVDNPLLASGMKWSQRLCYFNAMIHFLYAVPRLIFLMAPLAYMLFGLSIIPGYWVAILAYALPHLAISSLTNSRIQGAHRHSFWNEIYETVLAPYILLPTLLALVNPKLGKFNVTDKGKTLAETRFDHSIAAPTTWMLFFNLLGVLAAPYRLFVSDPGHPGTILANLCWILFNMVILGVSAAVAHEQKQRRSSVRIKARIPIVAEFADGQKITGITRDMSVGGASVLFADSNLFYARRQIIRLAFPVQTGDAQITALVAGIVEGEVRLKFSLQSIAEQEILTRALYSRADSWIDGRADHEEDRPFHSLARVVRISFTGFHQVLRGLLPSKPHPQPKPKTPKTPKAVATTTLLVLLAVLLGTRPLAAQTAAEIRAQIAAQVASQVAQQIAVPVPPAESKSSILTRITLKDMGVQSAAQLRGPHSYYSVHFALAHTQLPRAATLNLTYHFDRSLPSQSATLQLRLNNTLLTVITSPSSPEPAGHFAVLSIPIPPELLIRDNELTFEFTGGGVFQSQAANTPLAAIGDTSTLELSSDPVPFKADLSLLPLPLFDSALQTTTTIPFVFLTPPDTQTLRAAGIVASWFGVLGSAKPVRFSVAIGQIPAGNVVVFSNRNTALPPALGIPAGPALSIKTNPNDPNGSALVLSAENDDQLLAVARALALTKAAPDLPAGDTLPLQGDSRPIPSFSLPPERKPDDAPRWMPTDKLVSLWTYSSQTAMQSDGSRPLPIYFRVPPDLYYGERQNLLLHLSYRYDAAPLAPGSALRVFINGLLINEAPLPPGPGATDSRREVVLPVINMRPSANTLLFNFDFIRGHRPGYLDSVTSRLDGEILRNSSLDIRGLQHWAAMPNLELFANAGFPFTQRADLSQTVVLLPTHPSPQEIALFLHLMSHCATQTGYPVLRVELATPSDPLRSDRDYLVLGTIQNQPEFNALEGTLPASFDTAGLHLPPPTGFPSGLAAQIRHAWRSLLRRPDESAQLLQPGTAPDAILEGLESPFAPGHSLVLVALRDDAAEKTFTDVFYDRAQSGDIHGSVSLLRGTHFLAADIPTPGYHLGTISAYTRMRIWMADYFVLLLLGVSLLSLLLASWIRQYLTDRAAQRLQIHSVRPAVPNPR